MVRIPSISKHSEKQRTIKSSSIGASLAAVEPVTYVILAQVFPFIESASGFSERPMNTPRTRSPFSNYRYFPLPEWLLIFLTDVIDDIVTRDGSEWEEERIKIMEGININ